MYKANGYLFRNVEALGEYLKIHSGKRYCCHLCH